MAREQKTYVDTHCHYARRLVIRETGHIPHWKSYGDGVMLAEIDFPLTTLLGSSEARAKRLSFDVRETTAEGNSKRVMFHLDEPATLRLYEMMKEMYEAAPTPA